MEDADFHFYVKLFLTSIVFVLVPLKIALAAAKRGSKPNLPPAPWKLPVIGNLHQLASSLPHHSLRDLAQKHGDLMHLQLGEVPHIVVSSADVASDMLRTHDANFSQRPFFLTARFYDFKNILFAPYGDYWRQLRKISVQELLSPARVQSLRSIREEEVSSLIEDLRSASGQTVNLSEKIFALTYGITAKAVFGKKCKDQEAFVSAAKGALMLSGGLSIAELFPSQKWLEWITGVWPKLEKQLKIMDGMIQDIINNARDDESSRGHSLLDVLLDIQEKGHLAIALETENVKAVIMDMFVAGSDTSSTTIEWAMLELSRNRTTMEKAQAEVRRVFGGDGKIDETRLHELKYLSFIIKETFRLHPSGPLLARESRESCVVNGYDIPAKTRVLVNVWAIGRDSRNWSDPDKFYPERFIDSEVDFKGTHFELIPFGAGRRMCPGVLFAMPNIELPLANILFHFDWKLLDGNNVDGIESFGLTVRPKNELYLIPVPHKTAPI